MPAKNTDKPNVHFSYSQFDDVDVEDFVYMTKANKRVVFPDPFGDDMDADQGERLLADAQQGKLSTTQIFEQWLTKENREAVQADKLSLRRRMQLIQQAISHYEKYVGDQGEGAASES